MCVEAKYLENGWRWRLGWRRLQWSTYRKWHMANPMVTCPMTSHDSERSRSWTQYVWGLLFQKRQEIETIGCNGPPIWNGTWGGWVDISRLRNEPVPFNQCSVFYTTWKMSLSAAVCVHISFGGLCSQTSTGVLPLHSSGGQIPQTLCAILAPNAGYATVMLRS